MGISKNKKDVKKFLVEVMPRIGLGQVKRIKRSSVWGMYEVITDYDTYNLFLADKEEFCLFVNHAYAIQRENVIFRVVNGKIIPTSIAIDDGLGVRQYMHIDNGATETILVTPKLGGGYNHKKLEKPVFFPISINFTNFKKEFCFV